MRRRDLLSSRQHTVKYDSYEDKEYTILNGVNVLGSKWCRTTS